MRIIVAGSGDVGSYLCKVLSEARYDVTLIEAMEEIAQEMENSLDVRVIVGNAASAKCLQKAGVADCDYFMSMTSDDQSNILACSIAKQMGAKHSIARVHDTVYTDSSIVDYKEYFKIDYLLNPEALSAVELAKLIRNPERVAVETFARGKIEVQQLQVSENSRLANKPLKNLDLPKDLRIGYVGDKTSANVAGPDTVLKGGDIVTLFGSTESLYNYRKLFNREFIGDIVDVAIYGATETAISIIKLLGANRFKIRLIDPSLKKCKIFAEEFPSITVINGSATSLQLLEEEQIGSSDYFISCTKKDEDNIMTSLQAKKLGVEHVCLVINKPDYEELLGNMSAFLNLELSVSPRKATANVILDIIRLNAGEKIVYSSNNSIEIMELKVAENAEVVSKSLREAGLPRGCVVAALVRGSDAKVPQADDVINAHDSVILIVSKDNARAAAKMFGH